MEVQTLNSGGTKMQITRRCSTRYEELMKLLMEAAIPGEVVLWILDGVQNS